MKALKQLVILLILVAVAAGAYLLLPRKARTPEGASLLPADTFLFLQVPNLPKAREGLKTTALYRIWAEPEVKEFFRKPVDAVRDGLHKKIGKSPFLDLSRRVLNLPQGEVFLAVPKLGNIQRQVPPLLLGIDVGERRKDADHWLSDWKLELKKNTGDLKEESQKFKDVAYTRWTTPKASICFSYMGSLLLVANDEDAFRDAVNHHKDPNLPSLSSDERYQNAKKKMPPSYGVLAYCNPKPIVGLLKGLALSMPQLQSGLRNMDAVRSISYTTTFTNNSFEDVIFVDAPADKRGSMGSEYTPTERKTMTLTSEKTVFYSVQSVDLGKVWDNLYQQIQQSPLPKLQEVFFGLDKFNREHECNMPKDLLDAIGPEFSILMSFDDASPIPDLVAAFEVRDSVKARAATDTLWQFARSSAGGVASNLFSDAQVDSQRIRSIQVPMIALDPSYTVGNQFFLITLRADTAKQLVRKLKNGGGASLTENTLYQQTMNALPAGAYSYSYLDTKTLFEHLYNLAPCVKQAASYVPVVSDYVDLDKMPKTQTISRYLQPSAAAKTVDKDGFTVVMISPIGLPTVTVAAMIGAGVAIAHQFPNFPLK